MHLYVHSQYKYLTKKLLLSYQEAGGAVAVETGGLAYFHSSLFLMNTVGNSFFEVFW